MIPVLAVLRKESVIRIVLINTGIAFLANCSIAIANEDDIEGNSLFPEIGLTYNYERFSGYFEEPGQRHEYKQRSLELELAYPFDLNSQFNLWLRGGGLLEEEVEPNENRWERQNTAYLSELWLDWTSIAGDFGLRLGRQSVSDTRSWWWDSEFDGIEVRMNGVEVTSTLLLAELAEPAFYGDDFSDPENAGLLWTILGLYYEGDDLGNLTAYFTRLDDNSSSSHAAQVIDEKSSDPVDANLNWLGFRYAKEFSAQQFGEFSVLLDTAYISGGHKTIRLLQEDSAEEALGLKVDSVQSERLRGWAADVSLTWQPRAREDMCFTVLYATASPKFQQTGVQGNETQYHYYGSLFNPSLSNMHIIGFSGSWEFVEDSTLTMQHLAYRINDSKYPVENELDLDVETKDNSLGNEIGIVLSHEFEPGFSLSLDASVFKTDSAYGDFSGKTFKRIELELGYAF